MWNEKPPMLSGNSRTDIGAIRDYLFRMAKSLEVLTADQGAAAVSVAYDRSGRPVYKEGQKTLDEIAEVRRNASELRDLIIKTADEVIAYTDSKTEEYNGMYVAQSEYGAFTESITTTIENTARGVVESYDYASAIESAQDSVDLMQSYFTAINGEIRRGIVLDPSTNQYVVGIAIAQSLQFKATMSQGAAAAKPNDGYDYYELNSGQTFGLYTATGWQFWIDGYKKGWYSSEDGMLHIANVLVEDTLQWGDSWQAVTSNAGAIFEIKYVG